MSLEFKSLTGLPSMSLEDLIPGQHVVVQINGEFYNTTVGDLQEYFTRQLIDTTDELTRRINEMQTNPDGGLWPAPRKLTLGGWLHGQTTMDGSADATLVVEEPADGSIATDKVAGLDEMLDALFHGKANGDHAHMTPTADAVGSAYGKFGRGPTSSPSTRETPAEDATILTVNADSQHVAQMAFGKQPGQVFWRNYRDDQWGDWQQFLTGNGEGMDQYARLDREATFQYALSSLQAVSSRERFALTDANDATVGELLRVGDALVLRQGDAALELSAAGLTINGFSVFTQANFDPSKKLDVGKATADYMGSTPDIKAANTTGFNTLAEGTRLLVSHTNANAPTGSGNLWWYVETLLLSTNPRTTLQRAYGFSTAERWTRIGSAGVWSAWRRTWDSSNFDPASKLDANANAASASKLVNARNFSMAGVVSAPTQPFDGTGSVVLNTSIADGALSIGKTAGLQAALDDKVSHGQPIESANRLAIPRKINGVEFDGSQDITLPTDGGNSDRTYIHEQSDPSDRWLVNHKLGKYPAVSVVDSAGSLIVGSVSYVDLNNVLIELAYPMAGQAFFN